LIVTHDLPAGALAELADGDGSRATVAFLRAAQHSKHLMLLYAVVQAAVAAAQRLDGGCPRPQGLDAFWAGYRVLAKVQATQPQTVAWLLSLPHVGSWAHDCLVSLDQEQAPDFGYLAGVAAAAALRAGVSFEPDVRTCLSGTPQIRAEAMGHAWDVLLESFDPHLARFSRPLAPVVSPPDLQRWRESIQSAWQVLARQRIWDLGAIADIVSTIVPLAQRDDGELVSETTPAAFGAIATMLPPDPVIMAETLIHEFQHLKLNALLDITRFTAPGEGPVLVYAPWRQDPRPVSGLLQGIYAHLAIVRFWDAQRCLEADPDAVLRAQVLYERWRPTIAMAADTLLAQQDCLTPEGIQFARTLREQGLRLRSGQVPEDAQDMAEQVGRDHWHTWQLRHLAVDPAEIAKAAAAFLDSESPASGFLPQGEVVPYTRRVGGMARTRMLTMRHLEANRFRDLRANDGDQISPADRLLIDGDCGEAMRAYRAEILSSDVPAPESWAGLATAATMAKAVKATAFATRLPLLFEIHRYLASKGIMCDPMELTAWLS
jgi:hypothetical protein